jgi:hypothetical protein
MKLIDFILVGACCFFLSVLGQTTNQTLQAGGATPDNYGCQSPTTLGCFPNGALTCVNPTNDPQNCGSCGFKCPAAGVSPAVAAKCTSTGCQCTALSKQCGTLPGTCEIITVNNCAGGNTCGLCTAPAVGTTAGQYCAVSGTSSSCITMTGCALVTPDSLGPSAPQFTTVPGANTITPAVCNTICTILGPSTFFTLAVDVNFAGATSTICTCYTGATFALATANAGTCALGSDSLSYYGATLCTTPGDATTCGAGSWQVYNSI